jgi:hypothetical protein
MGFCGSTTGTGVTTGGGVAVGAGFGSGIVCTGVNGCAGGASAGSSQALRHIAQSSQDL